MVATGLWVVMADEVDDDNVVLKLPNPDPKKDVQSLQLRLFKACCGLDRGAAAGDSERRTVFDVVNSLEDLITDGREFEEDGLWRLIFSSALSAGSGSGGGAGRNSLPIFQTPDTARLSLGPGSTVGQVYQRVQRRKKSLDNIVEFVFRAPLVSALQIKTVLNLNHRLESEGNNKHKIILRNVTARAARLQEEQGGTDGLHHVRELACLRRRTVTTCYESLAAIEGS
ncbi:hypothetical protein GUITHDRAFT_163935 [Guillardia theta CCMP2712]|uniref:Plastid lipid-associated protein/fibrillin conserved domain-containing protein n=1 Tax=Guillardia theta (strain CCMP2712) TaxID=905079 RepID=L1J4W7_GUITC|nr:hypothetical protein GUITHDRAFT_163935 [Guillardia theta CCMP2712]EKX43135.1 hypothetical protein GUITHDRAFT_163935 [Guillardia theta CCMP2712]|eukprot:XP_005830115.1 hypothetical protein GUITHDRAFT_163935 [Guillardia theta CCMP2712]